MASLLTPFKMRSRGPYCEGVGTHSSHNSVLWMVLTALIYWANEPLVLTRSIEMSHVAKKHSIHGAMGRK